MHEFSAAPFSAFPPPEPGLGDPVDGINDDVDADCTVAISLENLNALLTGQLNPVTGFMSGKFKVSGDMSVAMKLQRVV